MKLKIAVHVSYLCKGRNCKKCESVNPKEIKPVSYNNNKSNESQHWTYTVANNKAINP